MESTPISNKYSLNLMSTLNKPFVIKKDNNNNKINKIISVKEAYHYLFILLTKRRKNKRFKLSVYKVSSLNSYVKLQGCKSNVKSHFECEQRTFFDSFNTTDCVIITF